MHSSRVEPMTLVLLASCSTLTGAMGLQIHITKHYRNTQTVHSYTYEWEKVQSAKYGGIVLPSK